MSGDHTGVQRRFKNIVHQCVFVHCHAHRLNLVLVATVHGIQACEDFFSLMQLLHTFFSTSAKRHDVFLQAQKSNGVKPLELAIHGGYVGIALFL